MKFASFQYQVTYHAASGMVSGERFLRYPPNVVRFGKVLQNHVSNLTRQTVCL
jgi:hypothetical protein